MAEVILLCGKVAAGKSTYANRLAQQKRAVILSADDLVVRMRTKCEGPAALQQLEAQIRDYFLTLLQPLLQADVTVIIDHGHWVRSSRKQVISYCRENHLPLRLICVECKKEIRRQRLRKRNEQVLARKSCAYVISEDKLDRFDSWFEDFDEEEQVLLEQIESGALE